MDKSLRGCWRNTPSHLSFILAGHFRSHTLKVNISHASVMFRREEFGEVIGKIFSYILPVEAKLFLLDTTSHPFEAYVKCFGSFPAHVADEDAVGGCVVSFDWSGDLWMARFNLVGTACWLLRKIAPVSASAADAMTVQMVLHLMRISLFGVVVGRRGGGEGVSLI